MIVEPNKLTKLTINEVLDELELPHTTRLLGYAIHRPDTDEFAAFGLENDELSNWIWCPTPELAKLYTEYSEAFELASQYAKTELSIGLILDCETHLLFCDLA